MRRFPPLPSHGRSARRIPRTRCYGRSTREAPGIAVYALGDYTPEPDLTKPERKWPLTPEPWIVGGRKVSLAFRPVVPGQRCPAR